MTEVVFKHKKPNPAKLLSFGFELQGESYIYCRALIDGMMRLTVAVSQEGKVSAEIADSSSGEEYVLHRVAGAAGAFVGRVKAEYDTVLEEIAAGCFDADVFKSEQAKKLIAHVREKYGDELEYLWQKFPDNAILRRKDTAKWYAAVLTVSRRKLGFDSDKAIEILDLRMKPEEIQAAVDGKTYFPGYHMNKKHWITLCLDGTVSMDEIYRRIEASYLLAEK